MQFGLMDAGPDYGLIARIAGFFISLSVLVMIYMIIMMLSRYVDIRRQILSLIEPILAKIKKDGWELGDLTFPEARDPQFAVYAEALRLGLVGCGPFAIIETLNKTIDLVGRRFKQMLHYSRLLGWGVCLVGLIGALSETSMALRAASYLKEYPLRAAATTLSGSVTLFEIALVIGLIWLAISYFGQSRLSSLNREVSDRILKAAEERTAQGLKSQKV